MWGGMCLAVGASPPSDIDGTTRSRTDPPFLVEMRTMTLCPFALWRRVVAHRWLATVLDAKLSLRGRWCILQHVCSDPGRIAYVKRSDPVKLEFGRIFCVWSMKA